MQLPLGFNGRLKTFARFVATLHKNEYICTSYFVQGKVLNKGRYNTKCKLLTSCVTGISFKTKKWNEALLFE